MDNLLLLFAMGGLSKVKLRRIKNGKNCGKIFASLPLYNTHAELIFDGGNVRDINRAIRILRYAKWSHRVDRWLRFLPVHHWLKWAYGRSIFEMINPKNANFT